MTGGFEEQPATKRDLAEVKGELSGQIEALDHKVDGLTTKVDGLTTKVGRLETKIDKGFENLKEILKGPHGLAERLEKVEERVGLR